MIILTSQVMHGNTLYGYVVINFETKQVARLTIQETIKFVKLVGALNVAIQPKTEKLIGTMGSLNSLPKLDMLGNLLPGEVGKITVIKEIYTKDILTHYIIATQLGELKTLPASQVMCLIKQLGATNMKLVSGKQKVHLATIKGKLLTSKEDKTSQKESDKGYSMLDHTIGVQLLDQLNKELAKDTLFTFMNVCFPQYALGNLAYLPKNKNVTKITKSFPLTLRGIYTEKDESKGIILYENERHVRRYMYRQSANIKTYYNKIKKQCQSAWDRKDVKLSDIYRYRINNLYKVEKQLDSLPKHDSYTFRNDQKLKTGKGKPEVKSRVTYDDSFFYNQSAYKEVYKAYIMDKAQRARISLLYKNKRKYNDIIPYYDDLLAMKKNILQEQYLNFDGTIHNGDTSIPKYNDFVVALILFLDNPANTKLMVNDLAKFKKTFKEIRGILPSINTLLKGVPCQDYYCIHNPKEFALDKTKLDLSCFSGVPHSDKALQFVTSLF